MSKRAGTQVGSTITGGTNDALGTSVALNKNTDKSIDGKYMVIGATGSEEVKVYEFSSNSWCQRGSTLSPPGGGGGDYGYSVSINNDGTRIAIGTPEYSANGFTNIGQVQVYEYSSSSWTLRYTINTNNGIQANNYYMGHSVSLNGDGYILAFGGDGIVKIYNVDPLTSESISITPPSGLQKVAINQGATTSGTGASRTIDTYVVAFTNSTNTNTRVYDENGQVGSTIIFAGDDIAINNDGTIIAITNSTETEVWEYSDPSWLQVGSSINFGGNSVDISGDGMTVSIGDGSGEGRIYVQGGDGWVERDASYTEGTNFGESTSINNTGNLVAFGDPNGTGYVKVFNNITDIYIDEVYILWNEDKENFTGSTFLSNAGITNVANPINTSEGLKWAIQITNGNGGMGTLTMADNNLRLEVITHYKDDNGDSQIVETNIYLGSTESTEFTIPLGESFYIGTESSVFPAEKAGGYSAGDALLLLNDIGTNWGSLVATTVFKLYINEDGSTGDWIHVDTAGEAVFSCGYYTSSLGKSIYDIPITTEIPGGSVRREPLENENREYIPNTTYSSSDWRESLGTENLDASAYGDPHITTLDNEIYKFDYLGAFRLFDNGNGFIINGLSEKGPARWSHKQYIKKLFIQIEDKKLLIDTGFRSKKVKVLENESNINYVDQELEFNKEALNYCYECRKYKVSINSPLDVEGHILFKPLRNKIIFKFEVKDELYKLEIMNVNEYNLQPCRIKLTPIKFNKNNCNGCIVDRKYSLTAPLEDIKSVNKIEEPINYNEEDLPPIEVRPSKLNKIFI